MGALTYFSPRRSSQISFIYPASGYVCPGRNGRLLHECDPAMVKIIRDGGFNVSFSRLFSVYHFDNRMSAFPSPATISLYFDLLFHFPLHTTIPQTTMPTASTEALDIVLLWTCYSNKSVEQGATCHCQKADDVRDTSNIGHPADASLDPCPCLLLHLSRLLDLLLVSSSYKSTSETAKVLLWPSKYYPDDRGNPPVYQMKSALVSNSTKTNRSNPKF